jgi:hypothetical protein
MMDLFSPQLLAYATFGIILNFVISIAFGIYLSNNIGMEEMLLSKGSKEQPIWVSLALLIPFAKMIITIYRVSILQFYFLDQGKTHKEFWIYLTHDE